LELKLNGSDYAVSDGCLASVSGAEEILQRVLMKLTARRGGFALMPEFGSRLYLLPGVKKTERAQLAEAYIAEALSEESDISVSSVSVSEAGGEIRIALGLRYKGGDLDVTLSL